MTNSPTNTLSTTEESSKRSPKFAKTALQRKIKWLILLLAAYMSVPKGLLQRNRHTTCNCYELSHTRNQCCLEVAGATFMDVNFSCTVSNCGSLVCLLILLVCFVLAKVASMSIWREIKPDKGIYQEPPW